MMRELDIIFHCLLFFFFTNADMLAKRAAIAFNSMIDAVSRDDEYIRRVLEPAARFDDFTVRYKICHLPLFFC